MFNPRMLPLSSGRLRNTNAAATHFNGGTPTTGGILAASLAASDPSFANVALLLHADGAQDGVVFFDSSSFGRAQSSNGTIVTHRGQAKFGVTSAYWSGSGSSLKYPASTDFTFAAGQDFTVELFVNFQGAPTNCYLVCRANGASANRWGLGTSGVGGKPTWYYNGSGIAVDTSGVPTSQWVHLAYSRNGSTGRLFTNGALVASISDSNAYNDTSVLAFFGDAATANAPSVPTYIDEIRITRSARYTAAFTPSGTAFYPPVPASTDANFANVVLLMHGDGTDGQSSTVDSSSYARTISNAAGASLTTSNVCLGTAGMSFDGTNDRAFTAPLSSDFDFGLGDFTVEFFQRNANTAGTQVLLAYRDANFGWYYRNNGSIGQWGWMANGGAASTVTVVGVAQSLVWRHCAISRVSGVLYTAVNGAVTNQGSHTVNYGPTTTNPFTIGRDAGAGGDYNGLIDELRITKGVGRYTANFNPPTQAYPNSASGGGGSGAAAGYLAGLPYDTNGALLCTSSGTIDSYAPGGIPISGGAVLVDTSSAIAGYAPGGIPVTAAGALALATAE